MDPVIQGALISGGVAVLLQLVNWGVDVTRGQRDERRAERESNERRLDELRGLLDQAALALELAEQRFDAATRTGPRDAADVSYGEFVISMRELREWQTRLAVRLGQLDPLLVAFIEAHYALHGVNAILEAMQGPRAGVELAEAKARDLGEAGLKARRAALVFQHSAAAIIGPELRERVPRGDRPRTNT